MNYNVTFVWLTMPGHKWLCFDYFTGSPFGEFNLGSTIVLVFEAPSSFKFKVEPGNYVKYGQPLGNCEQEQRISSKG